VPKVTDYSTEMGNSYVVERQIDEISTKLMEPTQEDEPEEEKKEEILEPIVIPTPVTKGTEAAKAAPAPVK
jgi:hypothetical protein